MKETNRILIQLMIALVTSFAIMIPLALAGLVLGGNGASFVNFPLFAGYEAGLILGALFGQFIAAPVGAILFSGKYKKYGKNFAYTYLGSAVGSVIVLMVVSTTSIAWMVYLTLILLPSVGAVVGSYLYKKSV